MADERNTHLEKAAADDGRSFADDAVSNRSDDTALDEADVAVSRDRNWSPAEPADDEDAQSERGDERGEHADEPPVEDEAGAEASESEEAVEAEATDSLPTAGVPTSPKVEMMEPEPEEEIRMDWYILKVQSNREESIREGLLRRVKVAGLEDSFGDIIVPTEQVTEFKNGKKRTVKRKLYPGYIVVNMAITEETWFLVRETPGIGDFTGAAGKPSPMLPHEVEKIVVKEKAVEADAPTLSIPFKPGDRVKINEGTFENFEGEVHSVDLANGRVTVMINIFGRSTPVELESWQIESV